MEETLIIKNFGPIESVELKLKRFTILIGEQATGKSTVAKVLATIYSLLDSNPLRHSGSGMMQLSALDSYEHFKQHLSVYAIENYLKPDSFIHLTGKINFQLSNGIISSNLQQLAKSDFFRENAVTYIPADRIATSLFSNATWADLIDADDGKIDMPKYFLRFFSLYNRLKRNRHFDFSETLGISFDQKNGIDNIQLQDGNTITINESASAVQTNLPLYIIVSTQTRSKNSHRLFLVEEPELNFFPSSQHITIKYLVEAVLSSDSCMLLTTHSPYVLTSLNNLLYAYKVGQEHEEEINAIMEKKYWLNPDDVSAYRLFSDGTAKSIVDGEINQIDAGEIDGASSDINQIWDKISDIRFSSVNEN